LHHGLSARRSHARGSRPPLPFEFSHLPCASHCGPLIPPLAHRVFFTHADYWSPPSCLFLYFPPLISFLFLYLKRPILFPPPLFFLDSVVSVPPFSLASLTFLLQALEFVPSPHIRWRDCHSLFSSWPPPLSRSPRFLSSLLPFSVPEPPPFGATCFRCRGALSRDSMQLAVPPHPRQNCPFATRPLPRGRSPSLFSPPQSTTFGGRKRERFLLSPARRPFSCLPATSIFVPRIKERKTLFPLRRSPDPPLPSQYDNLTPVI